MLVIGADSAGFALKERIKKHLEENGVEYIDVGTDSEASCDYPVFAKKVAETVSTGKAELGILVCGTGIGMSMAANKTRGIRAAVCTNEYMAKYTRLHNDANVLCLGGRVIGAELAFSLVDIFLNTAFEGGRHQRRVDMFE